MRSTLTTAMPALPALTPAAATLPLDRSPAAVYLASLADGPGRASMRSTLGQVAAMLGYALESCPWHELRFAHVAVLRARIAARFAPATTNKYLSAIRQTLKQAWLLGLMPSEDYQRAAAFALMFGAGLRRSEAIAVTLEDYEPASGAIRIVGKGNRERMVYATNGGQAALDAWIAVRGDAPGPLLARVSKSGTVTASAGMTALALVKRLQVRARQAGIAACSPHDLRRSFVSSALEGGADIALVQRLAGHASPVTTARYDRRPEAGAALAARVMHVPFVA